MPCSRDEMSH